MIQEQQVPIVQIYEPFFKKAGVSLYLQREDLIHPAISGNKWYKLKYNLQAARKEGHTTLLTFGGAYSNHIYATAVAGREFNFKTIGIIRGEATEPLNYTLRFAKACGMHLHYAGRALYRNKDESAFISQLQDLFGKFYFLPEGGTNKLAVRGCTEMARYAPDFDYVCACVGTGGTLAGIANGMKGKGKLFGFSALKNGQFLEKEIKQFTQDFCGEIYHNIQLIDQYHFGGYAKFKPELIHFINRFVQTHHIPLDPVYTGKMMFGIFDLIRQDYFPKASRILAVHSGGLQGIYGFNERYDEKIIVF